MDCFFCGLADQPICESCNLTGVCPQHKHLHSVDQECVPYRVESRPDRGNTLVALRDIKPFQTILQDKPAVIGPFDGISIQCMECSKPLENFHQCTKCALPLCNKDCENGINHEAECKYFENSDLLNKVVPLDVMNTVIAPLRMIEIKKTNPELWKYVDSLEDHLEARKKMDTWMYISDHVLPFLKEKASKEVDLDLFCKIVGIFRTNSVKWEMRIEGRNVPIGHALCPIFSLLCHSCVSNTRYTAGDGKMTVRACVPIKKGQEITTQYRGPNDGNLLRRPDFMKNWMFNCDCIRCQDPTELGTHCGTMICPSCKQPDLYPRDFSLDSVFECRSCSFQMEHSIALEHFKKAEKMLMEMSYSESPKSWESLLDKFEEIFHPNHFICMKTSRILLQIYGSRDGYTLTDLSEQQLERKLELCKRYIDVFDVLEPGYRLWKGRLNEEMIGPLSIRLQQKLENDQIGKIELMLEYKKIIKLVKDASKCRQFLERDDEDDKRMGQFYTKWLQPLNLF